MCEYVIVYALMCDFVTAYEHMLVCVFPCVWLCDNIVCAYVYVSVCLYVTVL